MADTNNAAVWPLPNFRFEVDLSENLKGIQFQQVSGMDAENQITDYRHGNSPPVSTVKTPRLSKYGNITLKRGVFINNNTFWDWENEIKMNLIVRRTIQIRLLDETGKVTTQWTLNKAWPTKITGTGLKSDGNEVAVESIEIAYEQLTIKTANKPE
jgi:phage tail-like protein